MALRPPSDDSLKAALARRQQCERAAEHRRDTIHQRLRWGGWIFAFVLVVALMADLRNITRRIHSFQRTGRLASRPGDAADIARDPAGPRYFDPAGRFSLVPPRNWVRLSPPPTDFFDVVFQGPFGMDLSIQVVVTNGLTFDQLVDKLRVIERGLSADTHMDFAYVGPHRAVKRSVQLFRNRVLLLDFITGDLSHHVQFSAPAHLYDEYEPIFLRLIQTYEPGQILPAPAIPPPAPP